MNCAESRRLMHLDRPGERSESETLALRTHLSSCPSCAAEARSIRTLEAQEHRLRSAKPAIPDLSDVRARVLASAGQRTSHQYFGGSAPRLAYAAALVAVLAWFGTGQWQVWTAHTELNRRMSEPSPLGAGPQIVYTLDAETTQRLAGQEAALLPGIATSGGTIEITQSAAQQWLDRSPSSLVRTLMRRPAERARVVEALRIPRTAVDVTIRFRSTGASS